MLSLWNTKFFDYNYSGSQLEVPPDFVRSAEALGAQAPRVTRSDRMEPTIREALSEKGVILIEVVVDFEEMVHPMIAPGRSNDRDDTRQLFIR